MTRTGCTLNVCTDCYMTVANGAASDDPDYTPDREPLGLIPEMVEFTLGCLECEPCGHPDCAGARVCDCGWSGEGHGFSWSQCDGCGSTLGGDRYPLVVWEN